MQLLHSAPASGRPRLQWVCAAELVEPARGVVSALQQRHGIDTDLWRVDDWAALANEGIENERLWRQGQRPQVDSLFERLLAPTRGPILASSHEGRATAELLRAFAPPGRRYLSLCQENAAAMLQAALRLMEADGSDWMRLALD